MNNFVATTVGFAVVLGLSCATRRPVLLTPRCLPLAKPLSVAAGEVVISCDWEPDALVRQPWPSMVKCSIQPTMGERPTKFGQFILDDPGATSGFEPADGSAFTSWDGCFTIQLRDGRTLGELTVITSDCGVPFARTEKK